MILGWRRREWMLPTTCARCHWIIAVGITHVNDDHDPPINALCARCYDLIRGLGEGEVLPPVGEN